MAALAGAAVGIIATRRRYEGGGVHAMAWREWEGDIIATRSCGNGFG